MTTNEEHFSAQRLIALLPDEPKFRIAPPASVAAVLDAAYFVSLETEEGRPIRFCLVHCQAGTTLPAAVRFGAPLAIRLETLRRLAISCDPDRTCLVVEIGNSDGPIHLVGMCAEPDISPTFPENRWRTVKIRVLGPGAIELTVGDATVRFDRHSYESIDESRTISELVPAKYSESIATVCTAPTQFNFGLWLGHSVVGYSPELLKEHSSVLWEEALAVARGAATQTVAALIRDIRAGMHGGTIVFVDDPDEGESPIAQLDVIDAYRLQEWNSPMKPDPWNCGLLDYVGWRTHRELARRGITVLSDLGTSGQDLRKWADSVGWIRVKLAAELWEADTHATARLASTDGAVILDQRFRPLAFGCKFGSVNSGSHQDSNTENSLLGKGMRHRSAAAVVARDPNAMALVISQDGSVTAFRHDGDAVRARRVSI